MSFSNHYDVVIVGCGLAGLTTAYEISKSNPSLTVCLLEGRDRVGGRLKSKRTSSGKLVDLGGMWVGPTTQPHVCDLLKELDIAIYPQYIEGVNIHDDGRCLHQYTGTIPSISVFSLLDTHIMLSRLEKLARTIILDSEGLCKNSRAYDGISLYEFGRQNCWTKQAQSLLSVATRMVFGFESDQVSLLYFLFYCKTAGGIRPLLDSDGGGQDSRMEGGTEKLLATLMEKVKAAKYHIEFGCPVMNVEYTEEHTGQSRLTCQDGSIYFAKHIVMCCPPSCLSRMQFSPPAPSWKSSLWRRSNAGCWTKIAVLYETSFWRENGLSGSCVCEHTSTERPLSGVFDYCDGGGGHPALCGFVCGDVGENFAAMTEADQRTAVVSHLVHLFGPQAAEENVLDYLSMDWLHDPDGSPSFGSGGCPVDIPALGFFREHSQHLRSPICFPGGDETSAKPAIHFAGTETALSWAGYMVTKRLYL